MVETSVCNFKTTGEKSAQAYYEKLSPDRSLSCIPVFCIIIICINNNTAHKNTSKNYSTRLIYLTYFQDNLK